MRKLACQGRECLPKAAELLRAQQKGAQETKLHSVQPLSDTISCLLFRRHCKVVMKTLALHADLRWNLFVTPARSVTFYMFLPRKPMGTISPASSILEMRQWLYRLCHVLTRLFFCLDIEVNGFSRLWQQGGALWWVLAMMKVHRSDMSVPRSPQAPLHSYHLSTLTILNIAASQNSRSWILESLCGGKLPDQEYPCWVLWVITKCFGVKSYFTGLFVTAVTVIYSGQ